MLNWLPWRVLLKTAARSRGFIDPIDIYAKLQKFSQPSEVAEPIELLRAGVVFHARGLLNSKVIQHNLDWVWPYWIERQFDPSDPSFLPRAFSITHVNLTHRNWTAVGLPGLDTMPIVDPRGLVTPCWDGWSIDYWLVTDDGRQLLPSRATDCDQRLLNDDVMSVETDLKQPGLKLGGKVEVVRENAEFLCRLAVRATADSPAWLVITARPYNPEGVSFIDRISLDPGRHRWTINGKDTVHFSQSVERHHASDYHDADVHIHLLDKQENMDAKCRVGMVTAAAMYRVEPGAETSIVVDTPIPKLDAGSSKRARSHVAAHDALDQTEGISPWETSRALMCKLDIPDKHFQTLYETAVSTLVLCSPGDVYAGPYTYKRFWYRDAVFIAHGLLSAGLVERARAIINDLPLGQQRNGYYLSQNGEWDSNGEVLWLIDRYCSLSNSVIPDDLWTSVVAGADWIINKRLPLSAAPWSGLLPAGFSAEHLGPNDYYYWDNYWAVAGLESAARLAVGRHESGLAERYRAEADSLRNAIDASIYKAQDRFHQSAVPAAPARRLDAGAIGSVVAIYPLQLYPADNKWLNGTIDFLLDKCFYKGAFFQDMIHSGVNIYLTLHVAQALLRAGDSRYYSLIETVAGLASPTGHWPEAVHPATGGGCMGDGQHAWAAAEWIAIMRNCFVREEGSELVLGSGIPSAWLEQGRPVSFSVAPTCYGPLSITFTPQDRSAERCEVAWQARWHGDCPEITIAVPGYATVKPAADATSALIVKQAKS